jgi:hypothetical protein
MRDSLKELYKTSHSNRPFLLASSFLLPYETIHTKPFIAFSKPKVLTALDGMIT